MNIYLIVFGVLCLLLGLHFVFPDATQGEGDMMRIIYLSMLLILIGSGLTLQRAERSKNIKNAGIWLVIICGLALGYELLAKIAG